MCARVPPIISFRAPSEGFTPERSLYAVLAARQARCEAPQSFFGGGLKT